MAGGHVPKNGKREHGGGPEKGTPKKGCTNKFCEWCKAVDGPSTTHDTNECRRFNKDGSRKDRLTKPFNSVKRTPWNKPSGGDPAQMAYLTEEIAKLKKRLKKSKKHKKRARESSDSDSDDC
jgi:ribosomal protein S15P/S13E